MCGRGWVEDADADAEPGGVDEAARPFEDFGCSLEMVVRRLELAEMKEVEGPDIVRVGLYDRARGLSGQVEQLGGELLDSGQSRPHVLHIAHAAQDGRQMGEIGRAHV